MGWWETGSGEIIGDGPADVLIDTLKKLPAPPTLEVGCGTGLLLRQMADFARSAKGVNLWPGMLE